jgi:Protein of unknown function (DUF4235)
MKAAFLPVGIVSGLLAGLVGKKAFDFIWSKVDEEEPPEPDQREISVPKLVLALAIEGAIFRALRGLVDHGARRGFERFTGEWPGEEEPERA